MKIIKMGRNFSTTIETKKSNAGKEYTQATLCQSVKNQGGNWEKKYLNMFPEDLLSIIAVCQSAYSSYIEEKTNGILNNSSNETPSDLDSDIPF